MNDIKARIKSVNSTMQITKAMELVATSKLRRAKMRAEQSRAFGDIASRAMQQILSAPSAAESPYMKESEDGKVCYVVIAGDRGLAGGYNANIFRLLREKGLMEKRHRRKTFIMRSVMRPRAEKPTGRFAIRLWE